MNVVIVSCKEWHRRAVAPLEALGARVTYIDDRALVTPEHLAQLAPDWVFFPHWSYIIPATVYESFRCVIFHMTDLPFGRGGSPLQNLIARGIYETQVTALRCTRTLDGGDVYMKRPLSLHGGAEEIYLRAGAICSQMMVDLVRECPEPTPQTGEVVEFRRRRPEDGDIARLTDLNAVFDYIRMLDAAGYPRAFAEVGEWRLEFSRAALHDGEVVADVRITRREDDSDE